MTHEGANWEGEGKKVEVRQKMLILSGLPGSGKSRFASQWLEGESGGEGDTAWSRPPNPPRGRVNYDDLRLKMFGPDWKFNRKDEEAMKVQAIRNFRVMVESGFDVVIDNTNLTPRARLGWEQLAKGYAMEIEHILIDTSLADCIRNDAQREGRLRVGRAVIERMALFNGFIDFSNRSLYPRDFILVDMDGTVANCDARRVAAFEGPTVHKHCTHPDGQFGPCPNEGILMDRYCNACGGSARKNWPLFHKNVQDDPPIWPIVNLVGLLSMDECCSPSHNSCERGVNNHHGGKDYGLDIIVVSGRPTDDAGMGTEEFLKKMPWYQSVRHLFMRNALDHRPDFVVKEEILECLPKDRIRYVLDDRQQVVDMWRKNGLTCLQVADGQF